MSRARAHFEFRDEFVAYLPGHGVRRAAANYVTWINRAAKRLGLAIGPANLANEADVQVLLAKLHDIDQRHPTKRLLKNRLDESNQRSAFRKYAEMVRADYRGLFRSVPTSRSAQNGLRWPAKATIAIRWRDEESNGYTDVFPYDTFARTKTEMTVTHNVIGPQGGISTARCHVTVMAKRADLDYEVFGPFNTTRKMLLGVARLEFADNDRTAVSRVWWKPKGALTFKLCKFESVAYELPPLPAYVGPGKRAKKVLRAVRERPGQSRFRRNLKLAYENTCCISGCTIAEALDGAHIDPYLGPDFDHAQNGLLLRKDIHSLFDAHLIGVHPKTRTLEVTKVLRAWPEYAALQGKQLNDPRAGGESYRPATSALNRRWVIFVAKNRL